MHEIIWSGGPAVATLLSLATPISGALPGPTELRDNTLLISIVALLGKAVWDLLRQRQSTAQQARSYGLIRTLEARIEGIAKDLDTERLEHRRILKEHELREKDMQMEVRRIVEQQRAEIHDEQEQVRARLHDLSNVVNSNVTRVAIVETRSADIAQRLDRIQSAIDTLGGKIDRLSEIGR